MRISKLCLAGCTAILCAVSPAVRADDNPAQAAARAALEEQMRALDMQQASTNASTPAPVTPAQPAVTTPPPMANPPAMKTTNETNGQPARPSPVAVTPAPRVAPAQTPAPAASTTKSSGDSLFGPVPPPSGSALAGAISEGSAPLSATSAAPTAVPTSAPQSLPMESSQNNNSIAIPERELGLKPIVAPALPISPDQQMQLKALLEKYDAGAITPEEYQTERARILSQPR